MEPDQITCPDCGTIWSEDLAACPGCGLTWSEVENIPALQGDEHE
jgi:hypothetical protein